MRFPTITGLVIVATLPWLVACEVDVEDKGEMPKVDVQGDAGNLPEYEVTKTKEGEMPSIDVDAESGEMPEVDVRGPEVDVGTEPVTVPVPDVDVDMPDENEGADTNPTQSNPTQ